ncbi:MAG: hypothetical protein ABJA18_14120 [bacterium]
MADSLKRPHFFNGRLLSAEDFALEQQYHREKSKLHNRSLHGFGIVSGLKVTVSAGQIVVEPGLALDCAGNELIVSERQSLLFSAIKVDCHTTYVSLHYAEENVGPVSAGTNETAFIAESFAIDFTQENCNRGHRHLRARWRACGKPHALTIAKLRHSSQGWRVERSYRPPRIK